MTEAATVGRPRIHGERERIQLRSSAQIITLTTDAAAEDGVDRNAWVVRTLERMVQQGLPSRMKTSAAVSAVGGQRADLTIDAPLDLANAIKARAEEWQVPRSTWINLALASVFGGADGKDGI